MEPYCYLTDFAVSVESLCEGSTWTACKWKVNAPASCWSNSSISQIVQGSGSLQAGVGEEPHQLSLAEQATVVTTDIVLAQSQDRKRAPLRHMAYPSHVARRVAVSV